MTGGGELLRVIRSMMGRGLTLQQAEQIAHATVPQGVTAGQPVFREGEPPTGLWILVRGSVEILKEGRDGGSQSIATIEAPTVLGEMSLLTDRSHSATVRAQTDCDLHLLTKSQFLRLVDGESIAAYKLIAAIADVLARRLYRMDDKVLELSAKRDAPAPVEELAAFKQKLFSEWSF